MIQPMVRWPGLEVQVFFLSGDIVRAPPVTMSPVACSPCMPSCTMGKIMVINEFFVTTRVGRWYVDNGPESHGPYLSQHDAIADAIEAAEQVSGRKKPAAVLLKLPGSDATVVWTSRRGREAETAEPAVEAEIQASL